MRAGKYTVETFAKEAGLTRASALNRLSRLKREGYVTVSGGGAQKRIYTLHNTPQQPSNGFYTLVNKYSPEKLVPRFKHHVCGNYSVEHAIIDGIGIGDARTLAATQHLFRHVTDWKRLFTLAGKHGREQDVRALYEKARATTRVKRMPERYRK
ncbi:hypothetical protein AUJ68_06480 [Candidatus Woesearchaeota archaeon CG1_02_57_44]|nr:MAG: hypothetical protein AUJ68_06480 [Candidatus Woesearchaeota archaeon CG1_02_57_44]